MDLLAQLEPVGEHVVFAEQMVGQPFRPRAGFEFQRPALPAQVLKEPLLPGFLGPVFDELIPPPHRVAASLSMALGQTGSSLTAMRDSCPVGKRCTAQTPLLYSPEGLCALRPRGRRLERTASWPTRHTRTASWTSNR